MAKRSTLKESINRKAADNPNADEMLGAATGEPDTKRLNVNVPAPLYARFKDKAGREGRMLTWLVNQWIEEYVEGERGA